MQRVLVDFRSGSRGHPRMRHADPIALPCRRQGTVIFTTAPRIYLFWMLDDDVGFQVTISET
jgi:hypothetical protein